jgi:hypothetical protein
MKLGRTSKTAKILAITALLSIGESMINQGATTSSNTESDKITMFIKSETPVVNAPSNVLYSLDSIIATLDVSSKVVTKDLLRAHMFVYSQNTDAPIYDSINAVLDTVKLNSAIIDKDFVKSYVRVLNENPSVYDVGQRATRNVLDTMTINSKLITNKLAQAFAYVESKYHPDLINKSGAEGSMQVMPLTWSTHSKESFAKYALKPEKNVPVGVKHLLWLDKDISINYASKFHKNWDDLSYDDKVDYIAASYNGGHGLLYSVFFNIKRTSKDTREFVDWIKDARLLISLEDLLTFSKTSDVSTSRTITYDFAQRTLGVIDNLSFIETYLSKNYSGWSKADVNTKRDLVVVASTLGPRRLLKELKQPHKDKDGNLIKDWNFRNLSSQIASRVRDVNDALFAQSIANAWNYSEKNNNVSYSSQYSPQQRIMDGTQQLLTLENQLSKFAGWSTLSIEDQQRLFLVASTTGPNKIKTDWSELSSYSKDRFNRMNNALEQYAKVTEYKSKLFRGIAHNTDHASL